MNRYYQKVGPLKFGSPSVILALGAVLTALLACLCMVVVRTFTGHALLSGLVHDAAVLFIICATLCFFEILAAVILWFFMPDTWKIVQQVRRGLYHPAYGNPLHLREGERLPPVFCIRSKGTPGAYLLQITVRSRSADEISNVSGFISSVLHDEFGPYAVTFTYVDRPVNTVNFLIENVMIDRTVTAHSVKDLDSGIPAKLTIQDGTYLDLNTCGSILVAGKTRSGKTTGVISLLLQVLMMGRDNFGSQVIIVDPKRAELSRRPHVVTMDENGGGREILTTLKKFRNTITSRQASLDDLSETSGGAEKWWEVGMRPSFLFLDEYVALRCRLPDKAEKGSDYCRATFDELLKEIATEGASAGCFLIISIAEASVSEGGLPAMIRSALTTKILFRPTVQEGRLLWDSKKLENFQELQYGPGDAWFSSTDGEHDFPTYVHFPKLEFGEYGELGRLLNEYYADK